jgi:hypothetical protein
MITTFRTTAGGSPPSLPEKAGSDWRRVADRRGRSLVVRR